MELVTMLEMVEDGLDPDLVAEQPATPAAPEGETPEVTGYELDETDWEALKAIRDGSGESVDAETVEWLTTAGLVAGSPPALTDLAIEWMEWAE
jgi:hypothetical protein